MRIVLLYSVFAIAATLVNIVSQELALLAYNGPNSIYPALMTGTIAGLVTKYFLDKHYIFAFISSSRREDVSTFLLYSITGVLTTLLFWGTELAFDLLYGSRTGRYTGAVLGLSMGYVIKYQLDRRYVFPPDNRMAASVRGGN